MLLFMKYQSHVSFVFERINHFKNLSLFVGLIAFNATFNNISSIPWRSILLVEETEWSGEIHRPVTSY